MKAVLLDTDFLISRIFSDQSTHKKALKLAKKIENKVQFVCNLVLFELGTVLSHKFGQDKAITIVSELRSSTLTVIRPSEIDEEEAWNLFLNKNKKGISYTDCMNLYLAKKNNYKVVSFDSFYTNKYLIK